MYGYIGQLSKVHPDMVLVIPFFNNDKDDGTELIAYMPFNKIKTIAKGHKCEPAQYKDGECRARIGFTKYFNEEGLNLLEFN